MRLVPICFANASLALAAFGVDLAQGSVSGRFVGDATMARAMGTNGTQNGNGYYSCDEANTEDGQFSTDGCQNATTIPNGSKCVDCPDVNASGTLTNGQGGPITFTNLVDCTRNGKGSQKQIGDCVLNATGTGGVCETMTPSGQCTGSFNQWDSQTVTPP